MTSRVDRFRYRTRYFTDAGIIGSKEFVGEVFHQVKHLLRSKSSADGTVQMGTDKIFIYLAACYLSLNLTRNR